jgi:hypothetical protein
MGTVSDPARALPPAIVLIAATVNPGDEDEDDDDDDDDGGKGGGNIEPDDDEGTGDDDEYDDNDNDNDEEPLQAGPPRSGPRNRGSPVPLP